jgi:hypothetical protein
MQAVLHADLPLLRRVALASALGLLLRGKSAIDIRGVFRSALITASNMSFGTLGVSGRFLVGNAPAQLDPCIPTSFLRALRLDSSRLLWEECLRNGFDRFFTRPSGADENLSTSKLDVLHRRVGLFVDFPPSKKPRHNTSFPLSSFKLPETMDWPIQAVSHSCNQIDVIAPSECP